MVMRSVNVLCAGAWIADRSVTSKSSAPKSCRAQTELAIKRCDLVADMTATEGNLHLLRNSAWNASAFLLNVGLNLLILPFILHQLGAAVFGVAGLVTACIAPALTFSNALGLSTTRELARRLAPSQRDRGAQLFCHRVVARRRGRRGDRTFACPVGTTDCTARLQSRRQTGRRSGACLLVRRRRLALPVYFSGLRCRFHRASELCEGCVDQHREPLSFPLHRCWPLCRPRRLPRRSLAARRWVLPQGLSCHSRFRASSQASGWRALNCIASRLVDS